MARTSSTPSLEKGNRDHKHITHACALRFHQSFMIPASHSQNPTASPKKDFRVTYGVAGLNADELIIHGDSISTQPDASEDEIAKTPTVLFMGGMFCTRYWLIRTDRLAKEKGVRIVYPDRPGLGASTHIPLPQRMETWLATLPLLLDRLKIRHCVFMSHSAGTMYLLNSLYEHGEKYLSPKRPYVGIFGPWVHPAQSSQAIWRFCASPMLPTGVINYTSTVQKFFVRNMLPSFSWSSGVLNSLSPSSSHDDDAGDASGGGDGENEADSKSKRAKRRREAALGMPLAEIARLERVLLNFSYEESHKGGNEEAMLCLKKLKDAQTGKDQCWSFADDYVEYVAMLKQRLREQRLREQQQQQQQGGGRAGGGDEKSPLRIEAFFAESDEMTGEKGVKYFDSCFSGHGEECFEFEGHVMPEQNHDSVFSAGSPALDMFFEKVVWSLGQE